MHKQLLCFFVFLLFAQLKAQEPKGTGKNVVLKIKTSYNATIEKLLPTGHWKYTNAEGELCKEGDYKVEGEKSYQTGTWLYYNTEGLVFVKITYAKDKPQQIEILDSGSNLCGKSNLSIEIDTADVYHVKCFECKDILKFSVAKVPTKVSFSELKGEANGGDSKIEKAGGLVVYPIPNTSNGNGDFTGSATIQNDSVWILKYPIISASLIKGIDIKNKRNLVLNPGFDRNYKHKKTAAEIKPKRKIFPYWFEASETPDPIVKNIESYAGFRVIGGNYEVIGGELLKPLEAGEKYCFQMQIKLKETNRRATTNAGVILSEEVLDFDKFTTADFLNHPAKIISADSLYLCQRENWQTISGNFVANGDERFLYIGAFPPNYKLNILQTDPIDTATLFPGAYEIYYYVDNVLLMKSDTAVRCICNINDCPPEEDTLKAAEMVKIAKQFVFRNIQFETNKTILLLSASPSLDSLMELLEENPKMRLRITGHTDGDGEEDANQILSEERAKRVYDFLVENGIDATRLEYDGKGETEPIESNKNAKGRAKNRRVTFTVLD